MRDRREMDDSERRDALQTIIRASEQARALARQSGFDFIAGLLDAVVNQARADQLRMGPASSGDLGTGRNQ